MNPVEHERETLYRIAVSMMPGITADIVRCCKSMGITPEMFMTESIRNLTQKINFSGTKLRISEREETMLKAKAELQFVLKNKIKILFITDDDYPHRLAECSDAPVLLYILGNENLDYRFIFSVVGTRTCTPYGLNFTGNIVRDLGKMLDDVLVVSGLAYGIDAAAHKSSLQHNIQTAAVLAHGLHTIYPASHRGLAEQIVRNGGVLITEYCSQQPPHRKNFLERNRIVAGLCDATIVAESDLKGGAMSTANYAFGYGREVLALPGRATDIASRGCNRLIHINKAALVQSASDVLDVTGWQLPMIKEQPHQKSLFDEMTSEQQRIFDVLSKNSDPMSPDDIHQKLGYKIQIVMTMLSDMEFEGLIVRHPGNRYSPAIL